MTQYITIINIQLNWFKIKNINFETHFYNKQYFKSQIFSSKHSN